MVQQNKIAKTSGLVFPEINLGRYLVSFSNRSNQDTNSWKFTKLRNWRTFCDDYAKRRSQNILSVCMACHRSDPRLFSFKLINHLIIRNAALERISSYASWLVGIENLWRPRRDWVSYLLMNFKRPSYQLWSSEA